MHASFGPGGRTTFVWLVGMIFAGSLLGTGACGLSLDARVDTDEGGPGSDIRPPSSSSGSTSSSSGSSSSSSSSGEPPPPCLLADEDGGCVAIDETTGLFVNAAFSGAASDGTRATPFPRIQRAIDALAGRRYVYVCAGDYPEPVVIDGVAVTLVGGLDCSTWTRGNGASIVRASLPLRVSGNGDARTQSMQLIADDAVGVSERRGASSFAAVVYGGGSLRATQSRFEAGRGADGAGGNAGSNTNASASGSSAANGGNGGNSSCNAAGGGGGKSGVSAGHGTPRVMNAGQRGCNEGQSDDCWRQNAADACGNGRSGARGAGAPETTPPVVAGVVDEGWKPSNGNNGRAGGSGGGAGGGGLANAQNGGGGGAGGCGGGPGEGGGGGGASISVALAFSSASTILWDGNVVTAASTALPRITLGATGTRGAAGAGGGAGTGSGYSNDGSAGQDGAQGPEGVRLQAMSLD